MDLPRCKEITFVSKDYRRQSTLGDHAKHINMYTYCKQITPTICQYPHQVKFQGLIHCHYLNNLLLVERFSRFPMQNTWAEIKWLEQSILRQFNLRAIDFSKFCKEAAILTDKFFFFRNWSTALSVSLSLSVETGLEFAEELVVVELGLAAILLLKEDWYWNPSQRSLYWYVWASCLAPAWRSVNCIITNEKASDTL